MPGGPMVLIEDVHKSFGSNPVLKGIDLAVADNEVLSIIGPSGSGKSTLLRCINHLEKIDSGKISVGGNLVGYQKVGNKLYELHEKHIAAMRESVGMVFQHFNLFQHMTVLENIVEAPVHVRKEARAEVVARARQLLAQVGLTGKEKYFPRQLSGGQQQRVAIARALAMRPKLMLFDEPTSALDIELVGEVLDAIRKLADEEMTMIIVTHEIAFAREVSNRIVFMDDGLIVEQGNPEEILNAPRHPRTQAFLSKAL